MALQDNATDRTTKSQLHVGGAMGLLCLAALAGVFSNMAFTAATGVDPSGAWLPRIVGYALAVVTILVGALAIVHLSLGVMRMAVAPHYQRRELQAQRTIELLESINDKLSISETARQIIYREQDLKTFDATILKDIEKGEYDAALALVDTIAETYGFREQAEEYRSAIRNARAKSLQETVTEQFARLDQLMESERWDEARQYANKIERLYPDSARARTASRYFDDAHDKFKHHLEREFMESSERGDTEKAMELLKKLDQHLTEEEAEPFREAARGVFGQKRHNLAFQFKLAVKDGEWATASQVGEEIMSSFPNTKMAVEVRGMIDMIRARAAGAADAARSERA